MGSEHVTASFDAGRAQGDFNADDFDDFERRHPNIFASKLALLHRAIIDGNDGSRQPGRTLSVGGGTGSYEQALRDRFGVATDLIVEPAPDLAAQAVRRGFKVNVATIEESGLNGERCDTIFYNGSAFGYIADEALRKVLRLHWDQLDPGGSLILLDVPPSSALGLAVIASFDIDGPSYIRTVLSSSWYDEAVPHKEFWRTTEEYTGLLRDAGFSDFSYWQTLRRHPLYQNEEVEAPVPGCREGSYVAIVAHKEATAHGE